MLELNPEPYLYINPQLAREKGLADYDTVRIFNQVGEMQIKVKLTKNVPADAMLMYENWYGKIYLA